MNAEAVCIYGVFWCLKVAQVMNDLQWACLNIRCNEQKHKGAMFYLASVVDINSWFSDTKN